MKTEINKIFIAYKNSVYQRFCLDEKTKGLNALIKKKHPMTSYIVSSHKAHMNTIKQAQKILDTLKVKYKISKRTQIKSLKGYDLIITIGGDGTLFRTCHHIQNQLVLGVNSAPHSSVGAICSITYHELKEKLIQILDGDYKVKKLPRIQIKSNNKILPVEPINDILYANNSPAATSRYLISFGKIKEEHKSSGVWIATGTGSTAAISAAGGLKHHPQSSRLQYLTREPYQGIFNPYQLIRGFINKEENLKITSKMIRSRLYLDGPAKYFSVEYGDKIEFALSKNYLNLIKV